MATKTLGTLGTTTLTAIQWPTALASSVSLSDADIATIAQGILDDQQGIGPISGQYPISAGGQKLADRIWPGGFDRDGNMQIPNRGYLKLYPGDWVATSLDGAVLLIPARALPTTLTATGTSHTTVTIDALSVNVFSLGWSVGLRITESNGDIPAATRISAISADGKTITLTAAATGSHVGGTYTVGDFVHS